MADYELYNHRYALVKNAVVINVIIADSYPTASQIAQAHKVDEVVEVDQYFVGIGDQYVDGKFIHEGDEVERQKTLAEKSDDHDSRVGELEDLILELAGITTATPDIDSRLSGILKRRVDQGKISPDSIKHEGYKSEVTKEV